MFNAPLAVSLVRIRALPRKRDHQVAFRAYNARIGFGVCLEYDDVTQNIQKAIMSSSQLP